MKQEHFSLKKRARSFGYAFNGIKILFRYEHNAKIHSCVTMLVIAAGIWFNISINEWIAIALTCGIVLAAESFNSAIEALCDLVSPQQNPIIKKVKDLAAAAVLFTAIAALIVGCIIFIPYIIS